MNRRRPTRPIVAASAAVLDDGSVLLVRRKAEPNREFWAFPGGMIELGEHAREAAAREVLEETGVVAEIGSLIDYVEIVEPGTEGPDYHYLILCFRAHPVGGNLQPASDADEAAWLPLEMALEQELTTGTRSILDKIVAERRSL